jgi:hypothetical protein
VYYVVPGWPELFVVCCPVHQCEALLVTVYASREAAESALKLHRAAEKCDAGSVGWYVLASALPADRPCDQDPDELDDELDL